ncbi:MAG TPA: PH domain-containing protein [Oligoflexia bacterium]|nr:PH domain-containing protein [Oligoflexia bacterium]HMP49619.1 PH domain-containing protein [Oligoflexia bacterium]
MKLDDTGFDDIQFESIRDGVSSSEYPLDEVFGGAESVAKARDLGAEIEGAEDPTQLTRYYFFPTWRSQLFNLLWFSVSSIIAIWISRYMPDYFIIPGELFSTSSTKYMLHLPYAVLVPAFFLGRTLINIYNAKYIIDETGIEAQVGLVSLTLRQPRLRWEDIRGVEPKQTIWERMLGIGTVAIGSAMTQDTEVVMEGVANPRAIQLLINSEQSKRMAELKQSGLSTRQGVMKRD